MSGLQNETPLEAAERVISGGLEARHDVCLAVTSGSPGCHAAVHQRAGAHWTWGSGVAST
jgi:hypothetical protein